MKIILGIVLTLLYVSAGPFLLIWSLNNLFALNILYTFNNWLSCFILMSILSVTIGSGSNSRSGKYTYEKDDSKGD